MLKATATNKHLWAEVEVQIPEWRVMSKHIWIKLKGHRFESRQYGSTCGISVT